MDCCYQSNDTQQSEKGNSIGCTIYNKILETAGFIQIIYDTG